MRGKHNASAGRKPARLADVARLAGCSPTAVGKVLAGTGGARVLVGKETAARIRSAADALHYRPNFAARQLTGKPSRLIGILVDTGVPSVGYECLVRMERGFHDRGYHVMVGQGHESADIFRTYYDDFRSRGTAGVVCMSHSYHDANTTSGVLDLFDHEDSIPAVLLGKPLHRPRMAAVVSVNLARGMEMLIAHLETRGRTRPVLLMHSHENEAMRTREVGFLRALSLRGVRDAGRQILRLPEQVLNDEDLLLPVVESELRNGPDAIMGTNDLVAARVLRILARLGKRVPGDLAVTGVDNHVVAGLVSPSLTTLDQRPDLLSRAAIETLLAILEDGARPADLRARMVLPRLVVREST